MSFHANYLPKSDVVFTVMFLKKELCEKTLEAITGEQIELIDIAAEYKNDLHKAALNSIYFDIKTRAVDGHPPRLNNLIQTGQKQRHHTLPKVMPLTAFGHKTKKIKLVDQTTGEVYSDLLTIHESIYFFPLFEKRFLYKHKILFCF